MKSLRMILLLLLIPAPASIALSPSDCFKKNSLKEGRITCGEVEYWISKPARCKGSCGLIVDLHGRWMSPKSMRATTRLDRLGTQNGFWVVHPLGPQKAWTVFHQVQRTGLETAATTGTRGSANKMKMKKKKKVPKPPEVVDTAATFERYRRVAADLLALRQKEKITGPTMVTGYSQGALMTWYLGCRYRQELSIRSIAPLSYSVNDRFCSAADLAKGLNIFYAEGKCDLGDEHGGGRSTALTLSGAGSLRMPLHFSAKHKASACDGRRFAFTRQLRKDGSTLLFLDHEFLVTNQRYRPFLGSHCMPQQATDKYPNIGCENSPLDWGSMVMAFFLNPTGPVPGETPSRSH